VTTQCYAVKNSQVLKVNINVIPSNTQPKPTLVIECLITSCAYINPYPACASLRRDSTNNPYRGGCEEATTPTGYTFSYQTN